MKFNKEGDLIEPKIYLIWGSPACGKTTYVKDNKQDNDIVIDIDALREAITMSECKTYDYHKDIVITLRDTLYNIIKNKRQLEGDVWVIACLSNADKRNDLISRIKVDESIHIEATEDECISRAMNDSERIDKELQIRIINDWFNNFYND